LDNREKQHVEFEMSSIHLERLTGCILAISSATIAEAQAARAFAYREVYSTATLQNTSSITVIGYPIKRDFVDGKAKAAPTRVRFASK
jgi:hypothetical protein